MLGTAFAASFWSPEITAGESFPARESEIVVTAQPTSEPVIAIIANPEQEALVAKQEVLEQLDEANLEVTHGVNPELTTEQDAVVSPEQDSTCALQIGFSYDQVKKLSNVVF